MKYATKRGMEGGYDENGPKRRKGVVWALGAFFFVSNAFSILTDDF
jgi:hypothetical protein